LTSLTSFPPSFIPQVCAGTRARRSTWAGRDTP
jgi:hypothetical protein